MRCAAKWYARENCKYTLAGLRYAVPSSSFSESCKLINHYFYHFRRVLPEALDLVHHCERLVEAYGAEEVYGTKEFAERVYKNHRQVVDKSKW